jgi:RsiW-degrading membrane proteinase PrsW (M82 family)
MFVIYFFLIIALGAFTNYLIQKFRKDKKYKRKFYDFGDNSNLVLVLIILILTFFSFNFIADDPIFQDKKEQLSYGKNSAQPWLVSEVYRTQVNQDSFNLDLHHEWIEAHFDENQDMGPSEQAYENERTYLHNFYTRFAASKDQRVADIGELGLAIYYYHRNDFTLMKVHLDKVKNDKLKYLNTYLGIANYYYNEPVLWEQNFIKEIRLFGDRKNAYTELARRYNWEGRIAELRPLVYNDYTRQFVPFSIRTRIYIVERDLGGYLKNLSGQVFRNTNIIGFTGALMILLIWILYIRKVNVFQRKSWINITFALVLSSLLVIPVWFLYDWYQYILGFDLNGEPVNDFLYCVFGIGLIEELIKFLPFLIILRFTKSVKQPIDYILYACISALGFAFIENFRYFDDGSLHIMHSRALTASVAHMCFSSVIAYGLILAKFKYKKNMLLMFFPFFLIAALAHGFYDFWLISPSVSEFRFLTFLLLLTGILVFSSFINNALNNSTATADNINLNTGKLAADLASGLLCVFLFEYVCLTLIYGPTIGNRELISSTISGGYLILFVSIRLSNLDIIPGEWSPIDFFVGLLPNQVIYGHRKPNFNSLVGRKIRLRALRKQGLLSPILPVSGEIIRREKISGFSGWFLVKLDNSIYLNKKQQEYVLIRAKDKSELIGTNPDTITSFMLIPDLSKMDAQNKKTGHFLFVEWVVVS